MKARDLQKSQFRSGYASWEIFGSTALANIPKIRIFNNLRKTERSSARARFQNPYFWSLHELGKTWKYSLRLKFRSPNFRSSYELGVTWK